MNHTEVLAVGISMWLYNMYFVGANCDRLQESLNISLGD